MRYCDFPAERMLADLEEVVPGVRLAPLESWNPGGYPVRFEESCGCYSEYTTCSCELTVFLAVRDPSPGVRDAIRAFLREWAKDNLEWRCCSCCCPDKRVDDRTERCDKNCLEVEVRLFTLAGSGPVN